MAQQKGYGQFCPVARAAEILAERWTPLVLRELLCGSVRFNELHRGVPRISSALLSRRLKELEHAGVVERRRAARGPGFEYHLTPAGSELYPIIEGMGVWAQRWVRHDLVLDENLDPDLLMWDVQRWVRADQVPRPRRYVALFAFRGTPSTRRHYWLVVEDGKAAVCIKDPGYEVDLFVTTGLRQLTEIWLGHRSIRQALEAETLVLDGAAADRRAFDAWFGLSSFAAAGREPPGSMDRSPEPHSHGRTQWQRDQS